MAKQEIAVNNSVATPPLDPVDTSRKSIGGRVVSGLGYWARWESYWWRRAFRGPAPYALLIGVVLLFGLAWQMPFSYTLDSANELQLDQPFLHNFNVPEKTPEGMWFRWTKGEGTVEFSGVGKHAYRYEITAAGGFKPNTPYVLYANDTRIAEGTLEPGIKTYSFDIPADAVPGRNGDLRLSFQVAGIVPGNGENRELGFPFFSARVTPIGNSPVVPPFTQLGWLVGAIMLAYLIFARAGFAPWKAASAAGVLSLIPVGVVASSARPWLTIFSQELAFAFGWGLFFMVVADICLVRVWRKGWERRWVLVIFALTLALHLAGLIHPQTNTYVNKIVDIGFHYNRYATLWDAGKWWDKITSGEWGGRPTYYPELTYLLMGPFNTLIPDRRLLLLAWMTTFEASRTLMVFYLVRKVTGQGRAGVLAALFMAVLPIGTLALAWGEVANLMGEWFILAALCIIAVKWETLRRPWTFILLTLAFFGSFMVHPGEVVVSGTVFLAIGVVLWLRRASRKQAGVMLAAFALAVILAIATYHWMTIRDMVPQAVESLTNKVQGKPDPNAKPGATVYKFQVGGSVNDSRLGLQKTGVNTVSELITGGLKGFWAEARVYFDVIPLLFLPWGLWLLWYASRKPKIGANPQPDARLEGEREARRRLFLIGLVWLGTTTGFALVGLFLNLYVRYSLFLLPFVAITAGYFLHALWRRLENMGKGWAGTLLTVGLAAWLTIGTLGLFFDRIIYYGH